MENKIFEPYIIHLKNVIFFKSIIYTLLIIFLIWLLPNLNTNLEQVNKTYQQITHKISESTIKLYSIMDAGENVLADVKKYEVILDRPEIYHCMLEQDILDKIYILLQQYNRISDFKASISYPNIDDKYRIGQIKITNYDLNMEFRAPDFITFLDFSKNLYNIMPPYSLVLLLKAEKKEVLDTDLIASLSPGMPQNLIYSTIYIRIRELLSVK